MAAVKGAKKGAGKTKKAAKKALPKTAGQKRPAAKESEEKAKKLLLQKEALIKKLKESLARKEKGFVAIKKSLLQSAEKTLEELKSKAEDEVIKLKKEVAAKMNYLAEMKNKAEAEAKKLKEEVETKAKALLELKNKAEAEVKKLKGEVEEKGKALAGKIRELGSYKKIAEEKIFELEAKAKEYLARLSFKEKERVGLVSSKGSPLTLLGEEIKLGDKAPDFLVLDNSRQPATLDYFKGKFKIITSVPSLDTPVCNMETRRFNQEAGSLPDNVVILTISMDLPFAQARWCAAAGVEKVKTFSDYRERSFGLAYGVLVKELKLLARAVFIVDDQDYVRYAELVPEIGQEPDYERILHTVKALL